MPETQKDQLWFRFTDWLNAHQAIIRAIILIIGLVIFLLVLPSYVRLFFWRALIIHRSLAVLLILFALLALSLVWTAGQKLDSWAFLYINLHKARTRFLDVIMLGFTQLGNGLTTMLLATILFFSGNRLLAYELILGTITLWLLVETIKFIVRRSRPFILLTQTRIVGLQASGRSFPSGHTSQAFFLATILSAQFQFKIWVTLTLYGLAVLVGLTRMYVGAHYPRDVLAGAILGSVWGSLTGILDGYLLTGSGS